MPFLFLVDCFLPAAKKYAALCCHSNCVYDVENAHCAVDFGHSVGKCICIFICIFICLTNLWPTLNCPLSRSLLPPLARSLTLCTAMTLPLIRSLSFSWSLFALKCEIILNILLNIFSTCRAALRRAATFLPVVSVYESIGILFILSQPENEKRK